MKKYRWIIVGLLLIVMILDILIFVSMKIRNIDMTDMRLFVTYWKEQTLGIMIMFACYLGIKKVLND